MAKQNPTRLYKGLHTDSSPLDQPKGTYTMAWNAINEASDGNNNFISNEQSNELCGQITVGYKPIGDIYISDGNTLVFSTDGTNSEIGIIDSDCNYTVQVNTDCLNFQITNQIDAVFRVRKGCERTVYFTDGLNSVRYFNIDKPEDFKVLGDWDCELFNLFLPIQNACFNDFEILEQGRLKYGVYSFALQYLDADFNPTKWSYITQPIPIFSAPLNVPYISITGNSNYDTDSLGGVGYPSNKAIKFSLTDLDDRYPYYRIAAIESTSFNGNTTRVLISSEKEITKTTFIYDGNEEAYTLGDINEIRIQPEPIDSAQHIEQIENRLVLGNVKGREINFCSFQQYASQITSRYVVKIAGANSLKPEGGVGEGNSKDPNTYWQARGYMGDEVYAFGIVYVFKDGYESPAYHIPGTNGLYEDCENPCVTGSSTLNCLRVREQAPDLALCSGDVTSYTVNYTLNGVAYSYNRTINTTDDIIIGWNEIVCSEYPIENLEILVENNNCTAYIEEVPLYEFALPAEIAPGDIGVTWWRMDNKNDGTDAWGFVGPVYAREKKTFTCVGGLPPIVPGWTLLVDDCATTNTATFVRESPKFIQGATGILNVTDQSYTLCTTCPCNPPYPNNSTLWLIGQTGDWTSILYRDCTDTGGIGEFKYWIRSQSLYPGSVSITTQNISKICPDEKITTWNNNIAHLYENETAYNALPAEEQLFYWQAYNTAAPTNSTEGYMAYWQSPFSTYPSILDCEGNDYWGTDNCGNTLTGQPIRHHKFPDRSIVPQYVNNETTEQYQSTLVIEIKYISDQTDLDTLYGTNTVLDLTVDYDLDGIPQTGVDIDIEKTQFIATTDPVPDAFEIIQIIVITVIGNGVSGIDNVTFSGTIGTDPNMTITNVSVLNNKQITPNTDIEVQNLGIKFDNITYPHPDIVGHYIVRGDRDEFNRTVIAKGISNSTHESGADNYDYNLFSYFAGGPNDNSGSATPIFNQSDNYNYLFTAEGLFQRDYPKGTYVKQENRFIDVHSLNLGNYDTSLEFDDLSEFGAGKGRSAAFGDGYAVLSDVRKITYAGVEPQVRMRRLLKSIVLNGLSYDTNFVPNRKLYNCSQTNIVQIIEIAYPGMHSASNKNIPYVAVKSDRDIHPDLLSIQYYRTHNCVINNVDENLIFGGDIFVGPLEMGNTIYYQFSDSIWDTVLLIAAVVVAVVATIFTAGVAAPGLAAGLGAVGVAVTGGTAGAIFSGIAITALVAGIVAVNALTINQMILSMKEEGLQTVLQEDEEVQNLSDTTKNSIEYINEFISGVYVESTINLGYRQDHTAYTPGIFYKGEQDIRAYFRDKLMIFDETADARKDRWTHRGLVIPEVYHYNPDYSKYNLDNVYVPLPETYDCCSPCLETHPTRVHYSQQSFQEETADNFRVFLPNNYRDIEAEKGEITNIFRRNNNLYIHTEDALWNLPQNVQERITGDLISFIGTGEYFSIPPRLISDDDLGSAGSKHKWATIKTDTGVFFIDEKNADIYYFSQTNGLKPISNAGMRNFFKNNLTSFLAKQFKQLTDTKFANFNNPANPNGTGYHVVYDTRHERLILTKRDYLILDDYTASFVIATTSPVDGSVTGIVDGQLFYDTTTQAFKLGTGVNTYVPVELGDADYFENKSFTISYSLLSQSWISFHSYIPLYYIYIHNQFYSFVRNGIWKHGVTGAYQTFYGTRYPHVIEYISISSPTITRLWDELLLQTMARVYNALEKEFNDEESITFNKAVFYNSKQASGLLNLIVKDNNSENYLSNQIVNIGGDQITIDRNERNWTLNEIRDYRIDYGSPIWTKEWSAIKNDFPIDKVINISTIDYAKLWTDLQVMRDKYLVIRLIFDNFDNVNLITNYSFEKENPSFR